ACTIHRCGRFAKRPYPESCPQIMSSSAKRRTSAKRWRVPPSLLCGRGQLPPRLFEVALPLDEIFEALLQPVLDLPHPLATDAELLADFLQRGGVLRQQPRLENLALLAVERLHELLDLVLGELTELVAGGGFFGIAQRVIVRQHIEEAGVLG